ncbi:hypothetical protein DEO23_01420 [Brachybacterium endophyticum]|uniref:Uncharacterized protein n=1 Tax=Brachybacterium endophyticum TaxID=2182385 RepID=A0A2U2RN79_9MICO|nr:hypothetical protein [Brachybacterium endophyticum]PWH07337.1 hypothetical protein DEO23_01420 [Brachybacterium endophyticum]
MSTRTTTAASTAAAAQPASRQATPVPVPVTAPVREVEAEPPSTRPAVTVGSVGLIALAIAFLADTPELLWLRVGAVLVFLVLGGVSSWLFSRVQRVVAAQDVESAEQQG